MGKLLLGLASVLVLAVAACGGDEGTSEFSTREEGKLVVATHIPFPPFEDYSEDGQVVGFDADLVNELARRLGDLEVEWVDTDFETIFAQLEAGEFDLVASATTITPEREDQVDFTQPYYFAYQSLVVNVDLTPALSSPDDLAVGDLAAVQSGTTGEAWANEHLGAKGVDLRSFPDATDALAALEEGAVSALILDEPSAAEQAKGHPALELVEVIETNETYGFAVDPENDALLEAVEAALNEMIADGTYRVIYDEWFPNAPAGAIAGR